MVTVIPLAPTHAADAARLHIAGQPGAFLSTLGLDVLTVIYQSLPQSPVGFGFAALEGSAPNQRVVGFVSATTSTGKLFAEMATRRVAAFLPVLLRRYAHQPMLAVRSVQVATYPFLSRSSAHAGVVSAELLSIMVESEARSQGVGAALMAALLDECRHRRITLLDVTVEAANDGAQRFYQRHGFTPQRTFRLFGRTMRLFHHPIMPENRKL